MNPLQWLYCMLSLLFQPLDVSRYLQLLNFSIFIQCLYINSEMLTSTKEIWVLCLYHAPWTRTKSDKTHQELNTLFFTDETNVSSFRRVHTVCSAVVLMLFLCSKLMKNIKQLVNALYFPCGRPLTAHLCISHHQGVGDTQ